MRKTMRNFLKTVFIISVICQAAHIYANNKLFYKEDFKHYKKANTVCVNDPGIILRNDPIWTDTASVACDLSKGSYILKNFIDLKNQEKMQALFEFRFKDPDGKFNLVFRDDEKKVITIQFTTTGVSVISKSLKIKAAANFAEKLPRLKWRMAAVTIENGKLTVFVDENRAYKKILTTDLPKVKLSNSNFFGFKKTYFGLTNIQFRKPQPLPDTSVKRLLPASRAKTNETSGLLRRTISIDDNFGVVVKTGFKENGVKLKLSFLDALEKPVELKLTVKSQLGKRRVKKNGKTVNESYTLIDDSYLSVVDGKREMLKYYIRPLLTRYKTSYSVTKEYTDIIRDQAMLPKASEHPLKIEFKNSKNGVELYLDGSFVKTFKGKPSKLELDIADGAALVNTISSKSKYDTTKYALLDIPAQGMAKTAANAQCSLKKGFQSVNGVPILVADGSSSADIGLTRQGQGNWALEVDEYLRRSPFDGLLTEVHFTVPVKPYHKAYLLCAVDPAPGKDPVLTMRIAQYKGAGIGNNRLADTLTIFPRTGQPLPANMKKVGTVKLNGTDVPLYLVEVRLNLGKIIDLAMGEDSKSPKYLNIDFFGKPSINMEQLDKTSKPDPDSTSSVQIFGATLISSPVGMLFEQAQPSNVFDNSEKPNTTVVLKSFTHAKGKLIWTVFDVNNNKVLSGKRSFSFAKAGEMEKIKIDLGVKKLGWYKIVFDVKNQNGENLISHTASMALLGKDKRKAGAESPYGTWWFANSHLSQGDLNFAGPVMMKAGIRQVCWGGKNADELKPWKLTKIQMGKQFRKATQRIAKSKDPVAEKAKLYAEVKKKMDAYLKKFPTIREVMVFHESGPGNAIPAEVVGIKPVISPERKEREKAFAKNLNLAGEFFRKYYPNLKIVVGNSSSSASCMAAILRNGGNPDYIDYIGIETPSQVIIPEKFQEWGLQGFRMAIETVKKISGKDIPASGCYEFTYRAERDMGEQQQAEWYVRDALISLAADFKRIGPGILFDTSNSYYNGLWGGSGLLRRIPYCYPKKSYVAYAVLTSVLDRVKFSRQIATGSATVYALEFNRADGKKVYAFWTARGEAKLKVTFAEKANGDIIEMYGVTTKFAKTAIDLIASTSSTYILSDTPVNSVTITSRSFPKDMAKAKHAKVAFSLNDAETVEVFDDSSLETDMKGKHSFATPIYKQANIKISTVTDEEKGKCIEVVLDKTKTPDLNKYITEYAYIKLKSPVKIPGNPVAIGVWVKGDSNWGRIMFEIEDAEGEVWRSISTGGWGCDILDWPGNIAVNFDGWNYVALPLRDTELFNDHSPGPVIEQWVSDGSGDKKLTLPLTLKGLIVEMNRKPLELIHFKPVTSKIRIKDAGGMYE